MRISVDDCCGIECNACMMYVCLVYMCSVDYIIVCVRGFYRSLHLTLVHIGIRR